jgi:hypothetical protein
MMLVDHYKSWPRQSRCCDFIFLLEYDGEALLGKQGLEKPELYGGSRVMQRENERDTKSE